MKGISRAWVGFGVLAALLAGWVGFLTWYVIVPLRTSAMEGRLLTWALGVLAGQWVLSWTASRWLGAWAARERRPAHPAAPSA